jgi:hypothetical protein
LAGTSALKNEKRRFHLAPGVNERIVAEARLEISAKEKRRDSWVPVDRLTGTLPRTRISATLKAF